MKGAERPKHPGGRLHRLGGRERAAFEASGERLSLEELHAEVESPLVLSDLVDLA